jgi:hypothetical protein
MKSIVELDINLPQEKLAALFTDPTKSTAWMDDIQRYEPVRGQPGTPGSQYRLVPKKGSMVFLATVVSRDLPNESRLRLEASNVVVSITARFDAESRDRTRLVSEEVFEFKGLLSKIFGLLATPVIKRAHRQHMAAFKRFAEQPPSSP